MMKSAVTANVMVALRERVGVEATTLTEYEPDGVEEDVRIVRRR